MSSFYRIEGDRVLTGYGKCHASFGELVQGQMEGGEDFLITLPVNLWSQSTILVSRSDGDMKIICEYGKSADVTRRILRRLGVDQPLRIEITFERGIPIGKGLSSSTADMVSTVRALQEIFGFLLRPEAVSRIFSEIEPHDGLMYKSCVLYNHRTGRLLRDFNYVPHFGIVCLDFGGVVDTVEFNRTVSFDGGLRKAYQELVAEIGVAFSRRDDAAIAGVATEATLLYSDSRRDKARRTVLDCFADLGALGVVNTHSGTCLGLLFGIEVGSKDLSEIADLCRDRFDCETFVTRTIGLVE